jgi:hypothetical protein
MNSNVVIPFAKSEWADIVRTTLEVDKELKPTIVRRTLEAKDGMLHVYVVDTLLMCTSPILIVTHAHTAHAHALAHRTYEALEVRMLRTVVSSFFDMLLLTIDTIKAFGEQEDQLPA